MKTKLYHLITLFIVFALILLAFSICGCSGGQARIREFDEAGNLKRSIVIDPYVLGRDFVSRGGELYVEIMQNGTIVYWLVLEGHWSRVSPENAKMVEGAVRGALK